MCCRYKTNTQILNNPAELVYTQESHRNVLGSPCPSPILNFDPGHSQKLKKRKMITMSLDLIITKMFVCFFCFKVCNQLSSQVQISFVVRTSLSQPGISFTAEVNRPTSRCCSNGPMVELYNVLIHGANSGAHSPSQ